MNRIWPSLSYLIVVALIVAAGVSVIWRQFATPIQESPETLAVWAIEDSDYSLDLHDLTIGRSAICARYSNGKEAASDRPSVDSFFRSRGKVLLDFAVNLAWWREQFCAIPQTTVSAAIAAFRSDQDRRGTDDKRLVREEMNQFLRSPRRFPPDDLDWSNSRGLDMSGIILSKTSLRDSDLRYTKLRGALILDADLTNADLQGCDLAGALYNPQYSVADPALPRIASIAQSKKLDQLHFSRAGPVYALRAAFHDQGYREAERQLTYAIERTWTDGICRRSGFWLVDCGFLRLFFEWSNAYGLHPARPLWILLILIGVASLVYAAAIAAPGPARIWRVWDKDRIDKRAGSNLPEPIQWGPNAPFWALYFSLLSASQIGWREFNVGNWIARMQSKEYTLQGTGWVRTVSGIQALISVYLLASWALNYFTRPF